MYINDDVGKCNRLDKCGYHYTPKQYYEDHPYLRDINTTMRPWSVSHLHRQNDRLTISNPHFDTIPEWLRWDYQRISFACLRQRTYPATANTQ